MSKRVLVAVLSLALALALFAPSGRESRATHVDPILFVHGFSGSASNWDTMISRFRSDGWESDRLFAITYDSSRSNAEIAQTVKNAVDQIRAQTGAAKVDIITHSMGGLSSRYYLKFLGGQDVVDEWVSLGGPNHGTTSAYFCSTISCVEMRPGSSFLTNLNAGDETPGAVRYGTWWSPCDTVINPDDSVILSGATNTRTGCIGHISLLTDAAVYRQVRDFVR
ncbi:MAG TPA: triacylglycerol lipase [Dehalococcoidia bacterium]